MKNCEKLNNLSDIDDHYDVFLIDLWGVIHNGIAAFDNVIPVLQSLKQKKKMVFFITNYFVRWVNMAKHQRKIPKKELFNHWTA